jgi:WD40 repeat protein
MDDKIHDIASRSAHKPNVFISYSRDDHYFADQLVAALDLHNFEIAIDRHGISGGEDWQNRLGNLIRDADTVVFLLSPSSARSDICRWEVKQAVSLGKRIIPALCRPLEDAVVPPELSARGYIFLYDEPHFPGSGWGTGQAKLVAALNSDLDWLREHTRLLQRAFEWRAGGQPSNRLLSGDDIAAAKTWAARRPKDAPEPTALQFEFIRASEDFESERQSEERRRLEERERLVHEAERATAERAAAARRTVRLTRIGSVTMLVLALLAGALAVYARLERDEADMRKVRAEAEAARAESAAKDAAQAREQAVKTRDAAVLAQSQYLTDLSFQETEERNNPVNGILLALEALPDKDSDDTLQRDKTFWPPAEMALEMARQAVRESQVISSGENDLLAVAPNGSHVALRGAEGILRIREIGSLKEISSFAFGPNIISAVFTADGTSLVTGAADGTVRLWDLASGRELFWLKADDKQISTVKISQDGTRLVTVSDNKLLRIWDLTAQKQVARLPVEEAGLLSSAVTLDGRRVITGGWNDRVHVWDIETGIELRAFEVPEGANAVALTPDGEHLITGGGGNIATMRDLVSGRELMKFKGHTSAVHSLAVMPDGGRLISGSNDGTARVWDVASGRELLVLKGPTGLSPRVVEVWVTPDGKRAITQAWDGTTRIWDLAPKRSEPLVLTGHSGAVRSNVASSDGRFLVTASDDKTARVWDAATGGEIRALAHPEKVTSAVFTPDGERVVTGSADGVVRVWDLMTGRIRSASERLSGSIDSLAITPDGGRIVSGGYDDATARVWDARSGGLINVLKGHTDFVTAVAVTPDGTRVLTGSGDETIRVWDLASGQQHRVLIGHINAVLSLAVTPDSRLVVSGSADYTLRVWDIETGRDLRIHMAHTDGVNGIAITADGKRVLSSAVDGTIRLWELSSGLTIGDLRWHGGELRNIALTPDGSRVLTASRDGLARVWELFPGHGDIGRAKATVPRCLTPAERKRFHLTPMPPTWCARLQKWPYNGGGVSMWRSLYERGNREEVEIILDAVSAVDPSLANSRRASLRNADAWRELVEGRPGNGLADAKQAVSLAPQSAEFLDTRGQIYAALGRWAEAIVDLDKVIAGGVLNASTHVARGAAHEASGNRDGAIADYQKALARMADDDYEKRAHVTARERLAALGVQMDQDSNQ